MKSFAVSYAGALVAFLAIDAIWIGVVARRFYAEQLGDLMRPAPWMGVAAVFYLMYAVAIVVLAIQPALRDASASKAALLGAMLGFAAYGTYDITNLSTLRGWPWQVSLIDWGWGTLLTGFSAWAGYLAAKSVG